MAGEQLDLFAPASWAAEPRGPRNAPAPDAGRYSDEALIDALASAGLTSAPVLAAETARRRLEAAIPALERLCRRFAGYGGVAIVPEQKAAIEALAAIGGGSARAAVARLIDARVIRGATLALALGKAALLGAALRPAVLAALVCDADPAIRAAACRCVSSPAPELIPALIELLDDLHASVADAAACALGRIGRKEGLPRVKSLLRAAPSDETVEAAAAAADDEMRVMLRRIALTMPALADAVTTALAE
jgi:HEAT repeats